MVAKNNIAVIPARMGSKRIPRKNIIDFCGKPMIAWTIEAALNADIFDRVVVSTDNQEIAEISIKYGAEVPFLRSEYSDDFTPVSIVTIDALMQMCKILDEEYDNVVQLMPNCPLRDSEDIRSAYNYFIERDINFQISCAQFGWMNPWWSVKLNDYGEPEPLFQECFKMRSQDMEKLFFPTGAIWIAKVAMLKEDGSFYGRGHRFYPMSWKNAVDIDDINDLEMARIMYELVHNGTNKSF